MFARGASTGLRQQGTCCAQEQACGSKVRVFDAVYPTAKAVGLIRKAKQQQIPPRVVTPANKLVRRGPRVRCVFRLRAPTRSKAAQLWMTARNNKGKSEMRILRAARSE